MHSIFASLSLRVPHFFCTAVAAIVFFSTGCTNTDTGSIATDAAENPGFSEVTEAGNRQSSNSCVDFNEQFIAGLYDQQIDPERIDDVFELIFSNLPENAVIYPTENYYYFKFSCDGKMFAGNLRLDVQDRDEGILYFGYFEYDENGKFQDRDANLKAYSEKDAVIVSKKGRFEYSVSYRGRTVSFHLFDVGMDPPAKARMIEEEVFVGPVFDESGLRFYIIYNTSEKHLMFILNEDDYVPEQFRYVNERVAFGRRTGFAFYDDRENNRKILIGVNSANSLRNNYYDGPFDQLPDNYPTRIGEYIEEMYPYARGVVDERGVYTNQTGARVAVTPYFTYPSEDYIVSTVESCAASGLTRSEFYCTITHDFKEQAGGENDEDEKE